MQRRATPTEGRPHEEATVPAVAPAPPSPASRVLALQRTLGNRGVTSLLARKDKPKPPTPIGVDVDDKAGTIKSAAGEAIGFKAADGTWYATSGGLAPAAARTGDLEASDGKVPILKMKKSKVQTADDGTETMTQEGAEVGAVLGAAPAVVLSGKATVAHASLPATLKAKLPANARVVLDDGRVWVTMEFPDGSGLNWVESKHSRKDYESKRKAISTVMDTLPDDLKKKLGPDLDVMGLISTLEGNFGSRSETFWQPKCSHDAHGKKGWWGKKTRDKAAAEEEAAKHDEEENKKQADEAKKDPDAAAKKKPVDHDAALVMSGDAAASLGIHQWAMDKDTAAGEGSLVEFFRTLHKRATAAEAKKPADRSEEDTLYIEAWKQCTAAGMSFSGKTIKLNGKEPTGLEVEDALAGAMGTGALRGYQIIAMGEELNDKLWTQQVLPGMFGSSTIANKYTATNIEKDAAFPTDKYTIKLTAPSKVATVGEVCTDAKLRVAVANVFPNRPAWMGSLVWRSIIDGDPEKLAAGLIAKIVEAQDKAAAAAAASAPAAPPAAPAAPAGPVPKDKKAKPAPAAAKPDITEATAADKKSMQELQALVWPSGKDADQGKALAAFYAATLRYYKAEDEKTLPGGDWRKHPKRTPKKRRLLYDWKSRSGRLATTESLF
jgi:hypothetical protein